MDDTNLSVGADAEPPRGPFSDNPRLPSDGGLSSLGLVMQLGAALFFCLNLLLVLVILMTPRMPGGSRGIIFLVAFLGIVRCVIHYAAGSRLAESAVDGRARATTYVNVAVVQTIILALLLAVAVPGMGGGTVVYFALMLLAWPAVIFWAMRRPQVRELYSRVSVGELDLQGVNRGIEGAGALMTAMGIAGLIIGALFGFMLLKGRLGEMGFIGVLLVVLVLTLLVRSGFHASAGLQALRGVGPLGFFSLVKRYLAASIASVVLFGVLALVVMVQARNGLMLLNFVVVCGLLAAWPFILNAFSQRVGGGLYFLDDSDEAGEAFGPAPDSGLTAIGYVLLGSGAFSLAGAVGYFFVEGSPFSAMFGRGMGGGNPAAWYLSLPVGLITLWAGFELVRMSERFKIGALVYAIAAGAMAVWSLTVQLSALGGLGRMNPQTLVGFVTVVSSIAVALVLPVLTVVLAYRHRDHVTSLKDIFS